jgi:hypothetical protein
MSQGTRGADERMREPPLESLTELERFVAEIRGRVGREGGRSQGRSAPPDEEAPEGLGLLARALERLRLFAYPGDRADWGAIDRARQHKFRMRSAGSRLLLPSGPRDWEFIGPRRLFGVDTLGITRMVSGRINALAVDGTNPTTLYAGAAGGGVWKSIDEGVTWTPLSDAWPFQEVSSLALDPTDSAVLYVGTGDFHGWGSHSFGVMKSTDGGQTFANLAAAQAGDYSISAIVVIPEDPSVVIMTGGRGRKRYGFVWRSNDGGHSWSTVVNEAAEWSQVILGTRDASGVRAAYSVGWNQSGGLMYRSLDRGITWNALSVPWGAGQSGIAVAASRLNPSRVYVLAGADRKVWTSDNRGDSWSDITSDMRQDNFEWDQLFYDWCLDCGSSGGPRPRDVLLLGLKHLFRWDSSVGKWVGVPHGHDDMHTITFHPTKTNYAYLGNDGGVFALRWEGGRWENVSLNATLGVTQCYRGAASPQDRRVVLAATQDNGVASSQTDLGEWSIVWPPTGGDAIAAAVSPTDKRIQFVEAGVAFYGISRTDEQWKTQKEITPPLQGDAVNAEFTPLAMDARGSRLYWGTDYLWMWDESKAVWYAHIGGRRLAGPNSVVAALAVAPLDPNRVYAGSTDGQLWMGQGPDWTWTRVDRGHSSLPNRVITAISVHPQDSNDILVCLSGTGSGHVWHCRDVKQSSRTWEDVSGSGADALPDVPAVGIARDPSNPSDTFYAGTDVGVFATEDGGRTWIDLTVPHGLPGAQLNDLQLVGQDLYAITFGRGVWRLRLRFTDAAPAGASVGQDLFVFAKRVDGRIFFNRARYSQPFQGWVEVPGQFHTDVGLGAASIEDVIYVFAKDADSHIWYNGAQVKDNQPLLAFSGWNRVLADDDFRTDVAPAGASVGQNLFVFAKRTDGRIFFNRARNFPGFQGWIEVEGNGHTDVGLGAVTIATVAFVLANNRDRKVIDVNQAEVKDIVPVPAFSGWFLVE